MTSDEQRQPRNNGRTFVISGLGLYNAGLLAVLAVGTRLAPFFSDPVFAFISYWLRLHLFALVERIVTEPDGNPASLKENSW
jgi:hypothetical protein